jgi:uncharacterized paraquat-inducible protein A
MKILKPGEVLKCPDCGRVLAYPNAQLEVAGKFVCPRTDRCERAKKKEPIEV